MAKTVTIKEETTKEKKTVRFGDLTPEQKKKVLASKKKKAKDPKKKRKKSVKNDKQEKEVMPVFRFKSPDGTLTSIPQTGKVNIIELKQESRTDYLVTRLPKELALKYSSGEVKTRYDWTIGDVCLLGVKYRGDAIDANKPKTVSEVYALLFCQHFGEVSADLEHIGEGIEDTDIKHSLIVLDESKALFYRNKWLVEKELREGADDLEEETKWSRRRAATGMAADITDDTTLAKRAVGESVEDYNVGAVSKKLQDNWLIILIFSLLILYVTSIFMTPGG